MDVLALAWLILFSTSWSNLHVEARREVTVTSTFHDDGERKEWRHIYAAISGGGVDNARTRQRNVALPVDETPATAPSTTPELSLSHWQRSTRPFRWRIPYVLPPAPVTPFRFRGDDDDR